MKAYFEPFNRHLVVDVIDESQDKKSSSVVLPTDYKKPQSPHVKALVLEVANDSKYYGKLSTNDTILLDRCMLNKIDINGYSFYLVLENYIYGRINNEINKATS